MRKPRLFKKILKKPLVFLSIAWPMAALCLCARPAFAMEALPVLHEQAIAAKKPDRVLLVGIARAGKRLVAVGEHGIIIISDDDGKSWVQSKVPVSVTITTVAFANKDDGWAAGDCGVILHTVDGGKDWTTQLTGFQVNKMQLASANALLAEYPQNTAGETAVRRANIFMNAGPDKPFLSILSANASQVSVFGAYRMAVVSHDGGQSWSDISLKIGDPVSHNLYGVAKVRGATYLAGETGIVLRSTDAGDSYSEVTSPMPYTLFGIMGTPKNAVLAYGVGGKIFRSVDQGKTWSESTLASSANITSGIILKSGDILVTTESGDVFVSSDDGSSFHTVSQNAGMALYDAAQAANGDIVFVGNAGIRMVSGAAF